MTVLILGIDSLFSYHAPVKFFQKYKSSHLKAGFGNSKSIAADDAPLTKTVLDDSNCPCGSGNTYIQCCKPYHESKVINDPTSLIKSRYSAYSTSNIDYIIQTTSKLSSDYRSYIDTPIAPANGLKRWSKSIKLNMLDEFQYIKMEIDQINIEEHGIKAYVSLPE